MARPREFDESKVLNAALACFWQHGYNATSMSDLGVAMKISAPSVYNAFGGKHELFTRVLERYLNCTTRDRLQRLESSCTPKEAIREFFAEIIDHSLRDPDHKGCFLVNSALEVAPHQAELGAVVAEQFEAIEAFFKRCILGAQSAGTVPRDIDAADTARLFLGMLVGIRVLVRTRPKRALLEGMVRPALGLLDKRRPGRK